MNLIWFIVVILVIFWLFGWLVAHIGGDFIHLLVVIALGLIIYNLIKDSRKA